MSEIDLYSLVETLERPKFKQLREPKPNKVSFRVVRYSNKSSMQNKIIIATVDPLNRYTSVNQGESFLENSFMALLEQEPSIVEYLPQSVPVDLSGEFNPLYYERKDGNIQEWTPDFSIRWDNGEIWVVEVKTISQIYKNKKSLEFLKHKWKAAEEIAKQIGWRFYVFTDDFSKKSWRVENIIDIESQMSFSSKSCELKILSIIYEDPKYNWTVAKLQNTLLYQFSKQVVLASVCKLIYENKLFIENDAFDIDHSNLRLTRDEFPDLKSWLSEFQWYDHEKEKGLKLVDRNQLTKYQKEQYERNLEIIQDYSRGLHYKEITVKYDISERTLFRIWKQSKMGKEITNLVPKKQQSGRNKIKLFTVNEDGEAEFIDKLFENAMEYYLKDERPNKKQN